MNRIYHHEYQFNTDIKSVIGVNTGEKLDLYTYSVAHLSFCLLLEFIK